MKRCENGSLHGLVREAIISSEKSPIHNVLLRLCKLLLSKSPLSDASHESVELPAASRVKYLPLILFSFYTPLLFLSHQLSHPCHLHSCISPFVFPPSLYLTTPLEVLKEFRAYSC